ncbi:srg family chemoreceptor domain-containing protein [Ditylenchus destructor]|uniref:Serpentine receptor class gamma n=1 Tax=Ditylenchus destructor TaxID=166010 RepID=A0AAD4QYQ3_9BILA|nr:srg family chemoreceptor domain-containing protein [Ditylenchus destructor]
MPPQFLAVFFFFNYYTFHADNLSTMFILLNRLTLILVPIGQEKNRNMDRDKTEYHKTKNYSKYVAKHYANFDNQMGAVISQATYPPFIFSLIIGIPSMILYMIEVCIKLELS